MKLRPYQQEAVDLTFEYLDTMPGNPCLCLSTGAGKSLIQAEIIRRLSEKKKSVLLLSHRAEILQQNIRKLRALLPREIIGLYSASLKSKRIEKITVGQVQSFVKKVKDLDFLFDYIMIDECHLVPAHDEGMYKKIIQAHPKARVIGLTATPKRLDSGMLVGEGKTFTHFSYMSDIIELIDDGYLCPLVGKYSKHQADFSQVKIQGKEYVLSQAMQAIDKDGLTLAAANECLKYGKDRKHWLVFCSGVSHAENVSRIFERSGISNRVVTGDTMQLERNKYFNEFERGEIKALINVDVLTTGFDAPYVDMIVLLRGTKSESLYVQIVGRGLRPHPEKRDCMILDFAGNLAEHGPIDEINYNPRKRREKDGQRKIGEKKDVRICPECRSLCPTGSKDCPDCGYVFPERQINHAVVASDKSPLSSTAPSSFIVSDVHYHIAKSKKNGRQMVIIKYYSGMKAFMEFLLFDHEGLPHHKSVTWWNKNTIAIRDRVLAPKTTEEAYARLEAEMLWPISIWVRQEGGYDRVISRELSEETFSEHKEKDIDSLTIL